MHKNRLPKQVLVLAALTALGAVSTARAELSEVGWAGKRPASLQVHRTANFSIEHTLTRQWAAELGEHLERLARQFPEAAAPLGDFAPPLEDGNGVLRWRCLTAPGADSDQHPLVLQASYHARRHEVTLQWMPDVRHPTAAADTGLFRDVPDRDLEPLDSLFLRVSHELAHQLAFDSGVQKPGIMYPLWVAEGLATNFESPGERLQYLGLNPAREERLARLVRRGHLLPLSRLSVITDRRELSREDRTDAYAQAWGFFRFLALTRNKQLKGHLHALASMTPGHRGERSLLRELEESFGDMRELESAWLIWAAEFTTREG